MKQKQTNNKTLNPLTKKNDILKLKTNRQKIT